MGGKVTVSSIKGKGTIFNIELSTLCQIENNKFAKKDQKKKK
jgi:hypothetical protein